MWQSAMGGGCSAKTSSYLNEEMQALANVCTLRVYGVEMQQLEMK